MGRLIRSGDLHKCTDEDIELLRDGHGLIRVVDFRTAKEREGAPDPQDRMQGIDFAELPVFSEAAVGITHEGGMAGDLAALKRFSGNAHETIRGLYVTCLLGEDGKRAYREFFETLLMAEDGATLWHCTEGKDRAGFVSALLECYMGAAYDEVVADYMVTYYNYYGVTKEAEPAKYDAILRSNIVKTLQTAFGVNDLKTADLKQEATDFFKELGLTDAELTTLTANLSKKYTGGSTEPETKSYVKVTAAPEDWSGTYLIVNEADETSAYVFNGNDAVNGYVSATIANSKITSSTELDAVAVTIEKTTDGYTLKVNGQYIYGTDGKNTLKFTDTAANAVNTITLSETDGVIITSNTSVLRFNAASNQLRFRYYKASTYSDQQAIQLYKLEG